MNDSEILVPETRKVVVGGRELEVHPFTLEEWIKLSRYIVGFMSKAYISAREGGKIKDGDANFSPIDVLPHMWGDLDRVIPIMAMAVSVEEDWLRSQTDIKGITDILKAIVDLNDFKGVIENFSEIIKLVKERNVKKTEPLSL